MTKIKAALMALLVAAAMTFSPVSPASASPHSSPKYDQVSLWGWTCNFSVTHLTNLYGYPIGVTDAYGTNCFLYTDVWLSSTNGWNVSNNFDDDWTWNPSVAVGPWGNYPGDSTHTACATAYGWYVCANFGYHYRYG